MNAIDILYTPLDCAEQPSFSVSQLKEWITDNFPKQEMFRKYFANNNKTAEGIVENYPWNLVLTYHNYTNKGPGWMGEFDSKFPELAKWMITQFGIELDDIGVIVLLPVKDDHVGLGFWHNDVDLAGLRFYLEFENIGENKLFIKGTKEPVTVRPSYPTPIDVDKYLQQKTSECKLLSNKQCFYLNNIRGCHATWTSTVDKTRIAAFVVAKEGREQKIMDATNNLIVNSALKFKD